MESLVSLREPQAGFKVMTLKMLSFSPVLEYVEESFGLFEPKYTDENVREIEEQRRGEGKV